ncbi:RHS repeat-associated core domain-containing protein [Leptospira noguchii]
MVFRNGDTLRYDSYGKLIEITPYATSSSIANVYDFQGNRVKSVSDITLISTYTLGENYEIVREPGKPEKHTLYVKGLEGDLVAQWTREDATLRIADGNGSLNSQSSDFSIGWFVGRVVGTTAKSDGSEESRLSLFVGTLTNPFCKEVTGDCGTYYRNRIQSEFIGIFGYSKFFQVGIPTPFYRAFYFLLLLAVIYLVYPYFLKENEVLVRLGWKGVGTPALILSLFVVTSLPGCGVLPGTGGKDGDPPWVLAMGANVNPGVPSIQNPGVGMTGGGSVGGVPVTGMFFFHPDHLGSITMITDGAGNPASGPEPGTSFVSYEPYGSIIRNDSYGPDIFRYKFTGQIEDKESGLYYYKSRFYEPILGRFLQADSVLMPTNVNGMNRYMYVDGNPVNYRDVSGHVSGSGLMHMVNRIIGHAMGKDFGPKGINKVGHGISFGFNKWAKKATFYPTPTHNLNNKWKYAMIEYMRTGTLEGAFNGYQFGSDLDTIKKQKRRYFRDQAWGTILEIGGVVLIAVDLIIYASDAGALAGLGAGLIGAGDSMRQNAGKSLRDKAVVCYLSRDASTNNPSFKNLQFQIAASCTNDSKQD